MLFSGERSDSQVYKRIGGGVDWWRERAMMKERGNVSKKRIGEEENEVERG